MCQRSGSSSTTRRNFETRGSRVTVENLTLSLPLNYGGMMVKNAESNTG